MRKTIKKAVILLVIFIAALAVYFIWSSGKDDEGAVYTSIEDANLPVVYKELFGRKMNCLYGFVEDRPTSAGRGDLTVLPEDRRLPVSFEDVDSKVKGIQYEIRSLDGERLVERTVLEEWTQEGTQVKAVLPIQNLLSAGKEYMMTLAISTEEHPAVYYYTRIMWSENHHMEDMLNLAMEFSDKTFSYDTARDLTTYLETDPNADNSSLGKVTLKNSFTQLTWRGLEMKRESEVSVHLREMQGVMGIIELDYVTSTTDEDGSREFYDVTESFTMKWNTQRIYMMNYDRRVNQIFSGESNLYSDKRIMLGISDSEELQTMSDPSEKYHAFVANRALWCYDADKGSSTKVFAFRKSEDDLRTNFNSHGVKILSVSEEGNIDFLVYGYMNRGNHEGTTGVALYRYENGDNTLTERLYLPSGEDYWSLRQDIGRLSYLSSNQTLYLLMDHAVYGVELSGKEYMVVADGLTEENFAVSADGSRIAWQDGSDIYSSEKLNVMDLKTGKKDEIRFQDQTVIRLVGFVGSDLVYGLANPGEKLMTDGRITGLPLYALEIVGSTMETETRYERQGLYLTDVQIRDSRVHMTRMRKAGGDYEMVDEDTLVCNEEVIADPLAGIGYLADSVKGRLYFVQLNSQAAKSRTIRVHVPKKAVAEENNVISLTANHPISIRRYYAYSGGRMNGSYVDFAQAVKAAYDDMGLVTDQNGYVFWVRANRSDVKTIKDIQNEVAVVERYLDELAQGNEVSTDGTRLVDARGCTLNQILYFVYRGRPVVAYLGNGGYGLIYGYDQYNISCLWFPGTEYAYFDKMGLNDAAAFFTDNGGNDFIGFLPAE